MYTIFDRYELIDCVAQYFSGMKYKVTTIFDRKQPPDVIAYKSNGRITERHIIECGMEIRDAIYRILQDMSSPRPTLRGEYWIAVPLSLQDEIPSVIYRFGINVMFVSDRFIKKKDALFRLEKKYEYIHLRVCRSTKKLWEDFSKTFKTNEDALLWLLRTKMIYRFIRPVYV